MASQFAKSSYLRRTNPNLIADDAMFNEKVKQLHRANEYIQHLRKELKLLVDANVDLSRKNTKLLRTIDQCLTVIDGDKSSSSVSNFSTLCTNLDNACRFKQCNELITQMLSDPLKRLNPVFKNAESQIKKRNEALLTVVKQQERFDKYSSRPRVGPNIVKQLDAKTDLETAIKKFKEVHNPTMADLNYFGQARKTYFEPGFDGLLSTFLVLLQSVIYVLNELAANACNESLLCVDETYNRNVNPVVETETTDNILSKIKQLSIVDTDVLQHELDKPKSTFHL